MNALLKQHLIKAFNTIPLWDPFWLTVKEEYIAEIQREHPRLRIKRVTPNYPYIQPKKTTAERIADSIKGK